MRTIIAFIVLTVSITGGWTESLGLELKTLRLASLPPLAIPEAPCCVRILLKDCLKNCNTNDNPTSCRQICLSNFRSCKTSAGCGGT